MGEISVLGIIVGMLLMGALIYGISFVVRRNSEQTEPVTHDSPNTQPPDSVANSRNRQRMNEDRIHKMSTPPQRRRNRNRRPPEGPRA